MQWHGAGIKLSTTENKVYCKPNPKHISIFVALGQLATQWNLALRMAVSCHSQQPLVGGQVLSFRSYPAIVSLTEEEALLIAECAQRAVCKLRVVPPPLLPWARIAANESSSSQLAALYPSQQ